MNTAMSSNTVLWTYTLAPDVDVQRADQRVLLRTAAGQARIEAPADIKAIELLAGSHSSEAQIRAGLRTSESDSNAGERCAVLLSGLERRGLLTRSLSISGRQLVSCVPLRPPPHDFPQRAPEGPLRLSPSAIMRAERNLMVIEVPGAWAKMIIHERALLSLLHDLAAGTPVGELTTEFSAETIQAILALMDWCGLLDLSGSQTLLSGSQDWPTHDLLFHVRTRAGYARGLRGKIAVKGDDRDPLGPNDTASAAHRIPLPQPDLHRLLADDPPHALVAERRRSVRQQGSAPLTAAELSEFLFRTLHERDGRRPYPSGGARYPLKAYVAVHRCLGLASGLFAYDPIRHELITAGEPGTALDRLLADAAGAAAIESAPQILVVLTAQYARMQRMYPDIGYSLILKEVGALFQAAMMAAAAMGLAVCPLGCGNAVLFSELVGIDPLTESSVGEIMLGSLQNTP
jgi:SagB-type dehydrogenase family enzyme